MSIDTLVAASLPPTRPTPLVSPAPSATVQQAPVQALVSAGLAPANQPRAPAPSVEAVNAAVKQIQQFLTSAGRVLDFHVDSDTKQVVVSIRDAASGDLIRQIPSEEAIRLAQALSNGSKSLVDLKA